MVSASRSALRAIIPFTLTALLGCDEPRHCDVDSDCGQPGACVRVTCEEQECIETFAPAGPAEEQLVGDCVELRCDGETAREIREPDPTDTGEGTDGDCTMEVCEGEWLERVEDPADTPPQVPGDCLVVYCNGSFADTREELTDTDDNNECTIDDACDFAGGSHYPTDPRTSCAGGNGFCLAGACLTDCAPQSTTACGEEGPNELANDNGSTPTDFTEPVCGFLDADDADWYTFEAFDAELSHDVLDTWVTSDAATIRICMYFACNDGTSPTGGCETKLPGPDGSEGCCWEGPGADFHPSWDVYCAGGSGKDEGDVYVEISAPDAGDCVSYAVSMSY